MRETYVQWLYIASACALVLWGMASDAQAHRNDGSGYAGHDAALCAYAGGVPAGSVACSDPAANPCYSGRSTPAHTGNVGSHSHAGFPTGKDNTAACQAYKTRNGDPHCTDGHCAPDRYRAHTAADHDCAACDDQNGTCGWNNGHRHPHGQDGYCPNAPVEPPVTPPVESCTCCEGVQVTLGDGRTCAQECASLTAQVTDACPVETRDPMDPPQVPVDPPNVDPNIDQMGCWDNPPHPYTTGCPGPNVYPGHDCASLDYHSHSDAFAGECHRRAFAHDEVGCGRDMHSHDDHACHETDTQHDGGHDQGHDDDADTDVPGAGDNDNGSGDNRNPGNGDDSDSGAGGDANNDGGTTDSVDGTSDCPACPACPEPETVTPEACPEPEVVTCPEPVSVVAPEACPGQTDTGWRRNAWRQN